MTPAFQEATIVARKLRRRLLGFTALLATAVAGGASAQGTIPVIKRPRPPRFVIDAIEAKADSIRAESVEVSRTTAASVRSARLDTVERLRKDSTNLVASLDTLTCSVTSDPGLRLCPLKLRSATARKAGEIFWDQEEAGGFVAAKMLNIQGLGDARGQRTYVELVSDLWNMTRVSLGGVFKSGDTTSTKSKAQQFLAGGGPAVVTLLRPIAVANLMNSHTVLLGRGQVSFIVPGQDETADDSLKFGTVAFDLQTSMDGNSRKIGGLFMLHGGQVFGGHAFYRSVDQTGSFFATTISFGLLVEQSASVTYTRFLTGPGPLKGTRDLIGVNFTR